ncbi:hypothetical protein KH5_21530 [Urechidicola sp. KH5]
MKLPRIITLLVVSVLLYNCSSGDDFLVAKNKVGKITNKNTVLDIASIFANDSIVTHMSEGNLGNEESELIQDNDEFLIYSKEGKHLLTIVPRNPQDSTSAIKYIEVFDPLFKTDEEISLMSPFKDVNLHYMIDKVETSLSSATLYIDELNATLAIDKRELGMGSMGMEPISVEQIPDLAKIKSMTIWFEE